MVDSRLLALAIASRLRTLALARRGVMEMFGEAHYQRAYQRGLAWADEVFRSWLQSGRPVPRELPLSKHEAAAMIEQIPLADLERQARATSVLYASARVRWRRLVSLEFNRRAS